MGNKYTCKYKRLWIVGVTIGLLSSAAMVKYLYFDYRTLPVPRTFGKIRRYDLLINAYQRSGSSYVGSLFFLRNDSFYWYEPLRYQPLIQGMRMLFFSRDGLVCDNTKQHCSRGSGNVVSLQDSIKLLKDIFDCRIINYRSRFEDEFSDRKHDGLYKRCRLTVTERISYEKICYRHFVTECTAAEHRVTKLTRLSIHHTERILQDNPRLKVIQLMRDPRGIINSRINTNWYPLNDSQVSDVESNAIIQCDRMRSDIHGVKVLMKRFPKRVRIVQYEDMAPNPEAIQTLYKWLGMDMPIGNVKLDAQIEKSTLHRVESYRDKLRYETLGMIQKHCADVIEILGLRLFKSNSEMRNSNISIVNGRLTYALS